MLNLPLPDRVGKGALENRIQQITKDMEKVSEGRDPFEWRRLEKLLDQCRYDFHAMYGKKAL